MIKKLNDIRKKYIEKSTIKESLDKMFIAIEELIYEREKEAIAKFIQDITTDEAEFEIPYIVKVYYENHRQDK